MQSVFELFNKLKHILNSAGIQTTEIFNYERYTTETPQYVVEINRFRHIENDEKFQFFKSTSHGCLLYIIRVYTIYSRRLNFEVIF